MFTIKEMFLTLQGEGVNVGRKALFVRFAGCNLWSGRPEDRDKGKGACAKWCDTDFFHGDKYDSSQTLVAKMNELWPDDEAHRFCVFTGGEPGLQFTDTLGQTLSESHWKVAVETNGTIHNSALVTWVDHLCLSPKQGGIVESMYWHEASELKVILPGHVNFDSGWSDSELLHMQDMTRDVVGLYVQPQDPLVTSATEDTVLHMLRKRVTDPLNYFTDQYERNLKRCIDFVMHFPTWRLCTQQHKAIGLR